ncbi:MAG: DUF4870 domain-containing protein [Acidobacteria bacterium]|nr:DUF4870 domain-containing protein [Acidobacteriota bacterium]MBK8148635.1 DUF4870 domain-containing protein [Acidobacteriota bacterium]MBK8809612.1 DUF4870 domain-containing protein [Acidobacteriota bacterium]
MQNMSGGKTALGLDTGIGVLICYFGNLACGLPLGLIYCILVVVQDQTNKVARFHAFQSLFLAVASIVIMIPLGIVYGISFAVDVAIGFPLFIALTGIGVLVFSLAILYFVIMAAIKGYGGEMYKIPVIGNFAEKYA